MKSLRMSYTSPEIKLVLIQDEDIITTSSWQGSSNMEQDAQQDFFS